MFFYVLQRIPPDFVKHIVMDASQTAKLKVPRGRSWRVELSKMVTGTYLHDGWPEFVKDNSLRKDLTSCFSDMMVIGVLL